MSFPLYSFALMHFQAKLWGSLKGIQDICKTPFLPFPFLFYPTFQLISSSPGLTIGRAVFPLLLP